MANDVEMLEAVECLAKLFPGLKMENVSVERYSDGKNQELRLSATSTGSGCETYLTYRYLTSNWEVTFNDGMYEDCQVEAKLFTAVFNAISHVAEAHGKAIERLNLLNTNLWLGGKK